MTNVAWTNVAQTDVTWTNVAWTNVAWSNGTEPLVNSQGWFHKLEMSSTVLSLGGWVGGEKLKLMLFQPSIAGNGLSWNWVSGFQYKMLVFTDIITQKLYQCRK